MSVELRFQKPVAATPGPVALRFGGGDTVFYDIPAASFTLTALAPTTDPWIANIPAADFTLTALAPQISPWIANVPAASFALEALAPTVQIRASVPAVDFTLTALTPAWAYSVAVPAADFTLTALAPTLSPWIANVPAAAFTLTALTPSPYTLAPPGNAVLRTVFRVYLTLPGEPDLELPARSFQARNRLTTRNYLAVVVPDPLPYIDAIQARSSGRLVIKTGFALADGTEVLEEIASGVFSDFRYDLGPFNGSATLVGYDYRAPGAPLVRPARGISFRGKDNSGARRVRCELDMYLKPGDTVELGDGETLLVDQVAYTVNASQATMQISEAEPDE
jgi:hypothetical protein